GERRQRDGVAGLDRQRLRRIDTHLHDQAIWLGELEERIAVRDDGALRGVNLENDRVVRRLDGQRTAGTFFLQNGEIGLRLGEVVGGREVRLRQLQRPVVRVL